MPPLRFCTVLPLGARLTPRGRRLRNWQQPVRLARLQAFTIAGRSNDPAIDDLRRRQCVTHHVDDVPIRSAGSSTEPPLSHSEPWWRSAVFYQIYPRSFADGNGDGIGDLIGAARAAGLPAATSASTRSGSAPFYRSPMADGGYDVADPCDVDPMFGTLADFDALVAEAHARGIRVTVDIVPNHFSDQHPWFQAALAAGPGIAGAGPVHLPRRARPATATSRRTTGRRCSAARPGRGCRTASGTCTCSRPSSPT